jgi:3-hydroxyacyl-[acyl-carrier-protein] dehydratase
MVMDANKILSLLPYEPPFLFVGELQHLDENGITGTYTFKEDAYFYKGHFKGYPVTPGVILTETMAQIGVVCLGIYLLENIPDEGFAIALTSTEVEFLKPVFPKEKVTVISRKIYFRFGKLKCKVEMQNERGEKVCTGTIAGMITTRS